MAPGKEVATVKVRRRGRGGSRRRSAGRLGAGVAACLAILVAAASASATALGPGTKGVPRVIGGTDADFASMAALVQRGQGAFDGQFCGGAVIAPTLVVTAAHCVAKLQANGLDVLTGTSMLVDGAGQRIAVAAVDRQPQYGATTDWHDIAVLRLRRPTSAPPVRLATRADAAITAVGRFATIYGWGKTRQSPDVFPTRLQAASVQILRPRRCSGYDAYRSALSLCAVSPGRDACQGDSGGPLVGRDASGTPVLIGLVSYGTPTCANLRGPTVYTRISSESAFLAGELAGRRPPPPGGATFRGTTAQVDPTTGRRLGLSFRVSGRRVVGLTATTLDRCADRVRLLVTLRGSGSVSVDRRGRFLVRAGLRGQPTVVRGVITGRTARGTITDRTLSGRVACTASSRWTARR